jgi:hypothetical protein
VRNDVSLCLAGLFFNTRNGGLLSFFSLSSHTVTDDVLLMRNEWMAAKANVDACAKGVCKAKGKGISSYTALQYEWW